MLDQASQHDANVTRLKLLAGDADGKAKDATDTTINSAYWKGFRDGLLRAQGVLEGRG